MPPTPIRPSELKNKHKREALHNKRKQEKLKAKSERRKKLAKEEAKDPEKKEKRLRENVPKTLENTREKDDTMVENDEEVLEEEGIDELADYFNGQTPNIVMTTSRHCSKKCYEFCADFISVFPTAAFSKRDPKQSMNELILGAKENGFTDLIVVNEDRKIPNAITLVHLPDGPSAYFTLTSYTPSSKIQGHGNNTAHNPETILNNFNTRLGHTIGRMFQALFPQVPEFQGRQVVTFHNQRDFIFVRRHRYVFKDTDRVGLQELGPKFTLKLRWLQRGLYSRDSEYEWIHQPKMETSRRRFFL